MAQTYQAAALCDARRVSPSVEFQQSFASRVSSISPAVDQLMQFTEVLVGGPRDSRAELALETAVREALANAVIHGNREDPQKRVYVNCRCALDGEVSITIRDEGQGFDPQMLPDPTHPDNRLRPHGRGILLMRALMDEVVFQDGGAAVRMNKRLR